MAIEILPDERALRTGRRERALAQMEAHGLDVLVLGRQANVRYFSGAPQLWVAGTRPFGPICTVVRSTGEIHLNSTWDEGIPEDIPHDHLYGLAWNPMTLIDVLKDGYVGEVGRTWPVGGLDATPLYERSNTLLGKLIRACRPGRPAGDLLAAYEAANESLPPMPVAHGLGLGFDPPVVTPQLP